MAWITCAVCGRAEPRVLCGSCEAKKLERQIERMQEERAQFERIEANRLRREMEQINRAERERMGILRPEDV